MKRKILNVLVVVLTISIIFESYMCFKNIKNSKVLEDIKTIDVFNNKDKTLSIMIQDPDTFEYEEDTSRTKWPDYSEYLYTGSKCTDIKGNNLEDTTPYIQFDESDNTATITTKKTIYCTLYFAKGRPALEVLKAKGGDYYAGGGEHTTAVDGLYRFKGTKAQITNNYICLGDENLDVCKTNTDNMYRIIGVTTNGNLKVIKAKKYGSNQTWHSDGYSDVKWNASTLYTYLNGTFYNSINARIKGLIEKHTWNMDKLQTYPWTSTTTGTQDGTVSANIGLMSAADYVNAGAQDTTNWLFIQNGLTGNAYENEWIMSRYGNHYGGYNAWEVKPDEGLSWASVVNPFAVRPVFYLTSNIELSGKGTEDNPFTIVPEKPKPALDKLEATTSEQYLKTVADNDELLRYVGTYEEVTNNFICFGTDDKEKCTSEPETYMYRIIGITSENVNKQLDLEKNQLKIIKATPVKESSSVKTISWASNYSSDIDWDNTSNTIRPYLNSNFLNTIEETWKGIISNPKWYIGDDTQATSTTGITNEKKKQTTGNYQVGLMYASDYYNSWSYGSNTNSWLYIIRGTSGSSTYSSQYEWTMTRYGKYSNGRYGAWGVYPNGSLNFDYVNSTSAVRPVFYLIPDITLTGSGTESNPFIINVE